MVDVERALRDVPEAHMAFWFTNGTIVKSLKELAQTLDTLDNDVFRYHVAQDKNDLYNWVLDVFGDEVLAERIRHETSKKNLQKKVAARVHELEEMRKPAQVIEVTTPSPAAKRRKHR